MNRGASNADGQDIKQINTNLTPAYLMAQRKGSLPLEKKAPLLDIEYIRGRVLN